MTEKQEPGPAMIRLEHADTFESHRAAALEVLSELRALFARGEWESGMADGLVYFLNLAASRWNDPDTARAAALLVEASGYRETTNPNFHASVLTHAAFSTPTRNPYAMNTMIAERVAAPQKDGGFGSGIQRRVLLSDPSTDGRGLLQVVDRLLDVNPAGSPFLPILWLDRAQAVAQLADGDDAAMAVARDALHAGTRAQNDLPLGSDDGMFWLERPYLAGTGILTTQKALAERYDNIARALKAAAENGAAQVVERAVEQALRLLEANPMTGVHDDAPSVHRLLRALLAFPHPVNREIFILVRLADSLTVAALASRHRRRMLAEAEAAARRLRVLVPGARPINLLRVLGARARSSTELDESRRLLAEMADLVTEYGVNWESLVVLAKGRLRESELGGGRAASLLALEAVERLPEFPDDAHDPMMNRFLTAEVLFALAEFEPDRALAALDPLVRDRDSLGQLTGRAIVVSAELRLVEPLTTATEVVQTLLTETAQWTGEPAGLLLAAFAALRTPLVGALRRLVPAGVTARDIDRATLDLGIGADLSAILLGMIDSRENAGDAGRERQLAAIRRAKADPGIADDLRTEFVWTEASLLLARYSAENRPEDLHAAAALVVSEKPEDDRTAHNKILLFNILEKIAEKEERTRFLDRGSMVLQDIVYDAKFPLPVRLDSARTLQVRSAPMWPMVWSLYNGVASDLRERVEEGGAAEILALAQGMAANAAYAATRDGDPLKAIDMAESGQGVLAAAALQKYGIPVNTLHLAQPELYSAWALAARRLQAAVSASVPKVEAFAQKVPSEPPTRRITSAQLLEELSVGSPEVRRLVDDERRMRSDLESVVGTVFPDPTIGELVAHLQSTEARLVYLVATEWGGTAVVLYADARVRVIELPELYRHTAIAWTSALNADVPTMGVRAGVVRGATSEPALDETERVVNELADILQPVADLLAENPGPIQVVPVGVMALLPVIAALQWSRGDEEWFELSNAASGRLHIASASRRERTAGNLSVIAVTNPSPATHPDGTALIDLPAASREGEEVARAFSGIHHTAVDATLAASLSALGGANRVLHFAVHGEASPDSPEQSRMYLADAPGGTAATLTAGEMARTPINSRLIYLGSCWTGRPGVRLPDEAVGFPTLLLQSGAAAVVAPMWPIDDGAAYTFASAFYRSFAGGATPARALADAMRQTREWHPRSTTWAAFALHGV